MFQRREKVGMEKNPLDIMDMTKERKMQIFKISRALSKKKELTNASQVLISYLEMKNLDSLKIFIRSLFFSWKEESSIWFKSF
jgi:hypothetical protein